MRIYVQKIVTAIFLVINDFLHKCLNCCAD